MFRFIFAALALLGACVTSGPFADIAGMQRRLDDRGIGFGVTQVPGNDAFLFQVRFRTSDAPGEEAPADPMAAAQAAAPEGCSVRSVTPQEDGVSYRVEYRC